MNTSELLELMRTRRSIRRFDQSKTVPQEVVDDILLSQQYASRSGNRQTLHYLVIRNPELVEKVFSYTAWAASLPKELGQPKEGEHPTLFIAVLDKKSERNNWSITDTGFVMNNMTLAAWAHGVGSCMIGNVQRVPFRELFKIPEEYEIHCLVAFGYPAHQPQLKLVSPGEDLKYYLDEQGEYVVPRLPVDAVCDFYE